MAIETKSIRLLGVLALLGLSVSATAGPFGFEMGQSASELTARVGLTKDASSTFGYRASKPISPHPDFKNYLLLVTPRHGLCRIVATTEPRSDSPDGRGIRQKFVEIQEALKRRYGDPLVAQEVTSSLPSGFDGFISKLIDGKESWWSYWSANSPQELPDNLDDFELKLQVAKEAGLVYLTITYDFTNADACLEENQKATDASL
jgi:hypothetical protein